VILHIDTDAAPVEHEDITDGLTDELLTPVVSDSSGSTMTRTTVVAAVRSETDIGRGAEVSLKLDPAKMHFFDLETGATLRASASRSTAGALTSGDHSPGATAQTF
jgi:hypothetical protein